MGDERKVVLCTVLLADQDVFIAAIPTTRPVFVGPAQAERQFDAVVGQPLPQRRFHQGATAEPIEIEAEGADAVFGGQRGLLAHHLRVAQVVEAKVGG